MNSDQRCLTISPRMNHEATTREAELVLAAKAGSHAAFAELRQMYSDRLYKRVSVRIARCLPLKEDPDSHPG